MEVGFDSLGSFSDLFARPVGTAPSIYQRRARVIVTAPGILPQELFPGCLNLMGCLPSYAFRNFREANPLSPPLECGVSLREDVNANQAHQHNGR